MAYGAGRTRGKTHELRERLHIGTRTAGAEQAHCELQATCVALEAVMRCRIRVWAATWGSLATTRGRRGPGKTRPPQTRSAGGAVNTVLHDSYSAAGPSGPARPGCAWGSAPARQPEDSFARCCQLRGEGGAGVRLPSPHRALRQIEASDRTDTRWDADRPGPGPAPAAAVKA